MHSFQVEEIVLELFFSPFMQDFSDLPQNTIWSLCLKSIKSISGSRGHPHLIPQTEIACGSCWILEHCAICDSNSLLLSQLLNFKYYHLKYNILKIGQIFALEG